MSAQTMSPRTWDARSALHDGVNEDVFRQEQEQIAARCWSVIGLAADLQQPGDWIMGHLGPWEVCVQNFGSQIRGFKNYCAHRFFPLRSQSKGNGPLRCPFHGWSYDEDGRASGIPLSEEMFGCPSEELNRRLKSIEVQICGPLVFGRLQEPNQPQGPSLETYLADIAPFLKALSGEHFQLTPMGVIDNVIKANWKTCFKLALDDYHIVEVHPRTFGRYGFLRAGEYLYKDINLHAVLFTRRSQDDDDPSPLSNATFANTLGKFVAGCPPEHHNFIFSVFPSAFVSLTAGVMCINKFSPINATETRQRAWLYRLGTRDEVVNEIPFKLAVGFSEKLLGEDIAVAEAMQRSSGLGYGDGLLGAQEKRIGWFNNAYVSTLQSERGEPSASGRPPAPAQDAPRLRPTFA